MIGRLRGADRFAIDKIHRLPKTVWALGFVSMFMDVSSEMIHALLPLFLTTSLGASLALVGLIDGVAESTASISKIFSGYFSDDRFRRRKPLIPLGYGLGAISKPLFALAGAPLVVFGARFADRIGKGVRGAPRDARRRRPPLGSLRHRRDIPRRRVIRCVSRRDRVARLR